MLSTDFDYEDILDALQEQNCALFIGPGLMVDSAGKPLLDVLWDSLDVRNSEHPMIRTFHEDDGFFLFREESHRRRFVRRIRRFYDQEHGHADALLQKLARIPFTTIFNLSPDPLLTRAFDQQRLPYRNDFYFKGQPYKPFETPSAERPLLYGFLGSMEEVESTILTHKDLFGYLESIFQGKSMSPELRKIIQDTKTFIFLGLSFEKWYMQLLLRVLYHISSHLEKLEQYASQPLVGEFSPLYEEEFRIKFTSDDAGLFIEELYTQCEKEGMLKKIPEVSEHHRYKQDLKHTKSLFGQNKMKAGFKLFHQVLEENQEKTEKQLHELILQQRSITDLNSRISSGIASESDKTSLSQAIYRTITLVSDTEKVLNL